MGARMLKRWIVFPLKDIRPINERLDVVEYFFKEPEVKEEIDQQLSLIGDMERLISKVAVGRISPREVVQLKVAVIGNRADTGYLHPIRRTCSTKYRRTIKPLLADKRPHRERDKSRCSDVSQQRRNYLQRCKY